MKQGMFTKISAIGFALAAMLGAGQASAGEDFAALSGISAQAMNQSEMAAVAGANTVTRVICFSCGGASNGTTVLRTTSFDNGGARDVNVGLTPPHPVFPGITNPAGRLTGWTGGL